MKFFGREPAFWIGLIVTLILGALQTLVGEGVISQALSGQITDGVNAVAQLALLFAPVLTGVLIRGQVTPTATPALPQGTTVTVVAPGDRPNYTATL